MTSQLITPKQEQHICQHSWYLVTPLHVKCEKCGMVINDSHLRALEQQESAKKNFEDMGISRDGYYK